RRRHTRSDRDWSSDVCSSDLTRGVAPRDHTYSATLVPAVVITVRAMTPPAESLYTDGTDIVTVPDLRWSRCDIKSLNLLANVLRSEERRVGKECRYGVYGEY